MLYPGQLDKSDAFVVDHNNSGIAESLNMSGLQAAQVVQVIPDTDHKKEGLAFHYHIISKIVKKLKDTSWINQMERTDVDCFYRC